MRFAAALVLCSVVLTGQVPTGDLASGEVAGTAPGELSLAVNRGEFIRISGEGFRFTAAAWQGTELLAGPLEAGFGVLDLYWIAADTGPLRVVIGGSGPFRIAVAERHPANNRDRDRVRAQAIEVAATKSVDGSSEVRKRALDELRESIKAYAAAGDSRAEALAASRLSSVLIDHGESGQAEPVLRRATELIDFVPSPAWQAAIWRGLGSNEHNRGNYQPALELFERSLALDRSVRNREGEVFSLTEMARIYQTQGETLRAAEILENALRMRQEIGEPRGIAYGLHLLGVVRFELGDNKEAMEYYDKAMPWWQKAGSKRGQMVTLSGAAEVYADSGENQKAILALEKLRQLAREDGDRDGEQAALNGLGSNLNAMGQFERSRALLEEGVVLAHSRNKVTAEIQLRINLAVSERSLGNLAQARENCASALVLARRTGAGRFEATAIACTAMLDHLEGRTARGIEASLEALALFRKIPFPQGEAKTLLGLGTMRLSTGNAAGALRDLRGARDIFHSIGSTTLENQSLFWLAQAEMKLGESAAALRDNSRALEIVESVRARLDESDLRVSYFVTMQDIYRQQVELQMRQNELEPHAGHDARALETAERARARMLLDSLSGGNREAETQLNPELAAQEKSLRTAVVGASARLSRVLGARHSMSGQEAAEKALESAAADYERFRDRIRIEDRHYANLHFPQPADVDTLRSAVLDRRTVLVEYFLGEVRSFAWVLSAGRLDSFVLPARSKINELERRAYTAWVDGASDQTAANELSRAVVAPLAGALGNSRLAIVADGALNYVPFAVLTVGGIPLIERHEMVMLPSGSVLAEMRAETGPRGVRKGRLAVLADPVFEAGDARVRRAQASDSRASSGDEFARLPWTRVEAERIAALSAGPVFRAFDFDANRRTLETEIGRYEVVHIASHGVLNEKRPQLSGIVLSLVDRDGRPQNGYIPAREIASLKLAANLVVLSACETAIGAEVSGEGVMSLTRAFEYAGVPRVMASIWRVPDAATADLMARFYAALLEKKEPAAAALREAQLAMLHSGRWKVRDWAGFILQGEFQ